MYFLGCHWLIAIHSNLVITLGHWFRCCCLTAGVVACLGCSTCYLYFLSLIHSYVSSYIHFFSHATCVWGSRGYMCIFLSGSLYLARQFVSHITFWIWCNPDWKNHGRLACCSACSLVLTYRTALCAFVSGHASFWGAFAAMQNDNTSLFCCFLTCSCGKCFAESQVSERFQPSDVYNMSNAAWQLHVTSLSAKHCLVHWLCYRQLIILSNRLHCCCTDCFIMMVVTYQYDKDIYIYLISSIVYVIYYMYIFLYVNVTNI